MAGTKTYEIAPSAARLTGSLRDIGYDFPTAIADLVDNSVTANATRINIYTQFEPNGSYVLISDNGDGMTERELIEALRFGTRRSYETNELGRFGLGPQDWLASPSAGDSRWSPGPRPSERAFRVMTLDLNRDRANRPVGHHSRMRPRRPSSGRRTSCASLPAPWSSGRISTACFPSGMRRTAGAAAGSGLWRRRPPSTSPWSSIASSRVRFRAVARSSSALTTRSSEPWDPFAPEEPERTVLPEQVFEIETDGRLLRGAVPGCRASVPGPVLLAGGVRAPVRSAEVEPPAGSVHLPR